MEKKGWKTLAIVFMVLFFSLVAFLWWGMILVGEDNALEANCSFNVCANADAYLYHITERVCECYTDGEIVLTEFLG